MLVESYDSGTSTLVLNSAVTLADDDLITIKNSEPSISTVVRTIPLENVSPSMYDNYDATGTPLSGTVDLGVIPLSNGALLTPLSGVNGANSPNSGQDLSSGWEIVSITNDSTNNDYIDDFSLNEVPGQSNNSKNARAFTLVNSSSQVANSIYTATINLNDAGGATSSVDFTFNFGTIPNRTQYQRWGVGSSYNIQYVYVTIIEITDQPASNGTNGWYYFKGSPADLKQTAENFVIYIDNTNASTSSSGLPACGSEPRLWSFGEEGPTDYIDAFQAAVSCFYGGIARNYTPESTSFDNYTFSIR